MNLFETLSEMIDLRSFSNLWYWIALAVLWSTLSHRILGVPFDMVQRARKHGGQSTQDLEDLVRINTNRMLFVVNTTGVWLLGLVCFVLSTLATLGFGLNVEFAQAVFLLVFPLSLVVLISLATARKIVHKEIDGEALCQALALCRFYVQALGMICIFVTALWGMWQNANIGPLGG
ncbi:component of SufBCD complex [Pseudophaeobacter sp.]|uniref:component of SufBCD complex n=1 Tax=Pseudophaeobacter sp. TaxID=1971739 RepID=UPI003298DDD0